MLKKIVIGILFVTVIGAGVAAAAYQASAPEIAVEPDTPQAKPELANQGGSSQGNGNAGADAGNQPQGGQEELSQPWEGRGTILALDDLGMTVLLADGSQAYVELGPPEYWQAQDVALEVGQEVTITGSNLDGQIHAYQVQLAGGQTLQLRNETGQPLWSGGAGTEQGAGGGDGAAGTVIAPDEWITVTGVLLAYNGGNMTIETSDGSLLTFQTGQPRFFADQGVTFQVGDEISVLGYYQDEHFMAGEITQVVTGLRVMLRDPNGRPLWAGPGNGNGNGGNGGNGNRNGGGHDDENP